MRNILVCLALMVFFTSTMGAQSTEELTALKTAKAAELTALEAQLTDLTGKVDALKTEVADLADKITPYPRWDFAAQGNIGINISEYRDWLSKDSPTTTAVNLAFTGNGSEVMNFIMPRVKLGGADKTDEENTGVVQTVPFTALLPTTSTGVNQSTIVIQDTTLV